jgi:hypothetical protein
MIGTKLDLGSRVDGKRQSEFGRTRFRALLAAAALACATVALWAPAAEAVTPPLSTGYVTDGPLNAVAVDGSGRTYLGGQFTQVGPRTGRGIKLTTTGDQPAAGFPDVAGNNNAFIDAVVDDGAGGWFIGGDFTSVGGVPRNRLAHINADGSVDPTWDPSANGFVTDMVRVGTDLYVGGGFNGANSIGGQDRNRLAKLSTTGTGAADPTWDPNANNLVLSLAVSGTDLYVGGFFGSIGGQSRSRIAKLSTTGTGAADATWNPNANSTVRALAVSGTDLYVGGSFSGTNSIGGQTRNRIAKLSTTGTGAADATWDPNANSSVVALAVSGTDLYAGGGFQGANSIGGQSRDFIAKLASTGTGAADATWNPDANSSVASLAVSGTDVYAGGFFAGPNSIGGQDRNFIAKLASTGTGAADPAWDPNTNHTVHALAVSGTEIYAGGEFTSAGGTPRSNIARLNADGTLDPTWDPGANQPVFVLALSGSDVYVGGQFTMIGGQPRNNIAKLSSAGTGAADATWDPNADSSVRALVVSGSDVFAGGEFSMIGGQSRNRIAKLASTGTGAADPTWNPNPTGTVVLSLAISGADLYVGGDFTTIGGQLRNNIAKLSSTGTGAADPTWNPDASGQVEALALSGTDLYAGGFFTTIGGQLRNRIAKLATTGTGAADPTWDPDADDSVLALAVSGSDLYAGGFFTTIGGQPRNRIARLATTGTGAADPAWDPDANGFVQALATSGTRLAAGGDFDAVGRLSTEGVALFDIPSPPNPPSPPPPGPSPTGVPSGPRAAEPPACERLRKKLKRQRARRAKAKTQAKRQFVTDNIIKETKERLAKLGC